MNPIADAVPSPTTAPAPPAPRTRMGVCDKCGRNRQVFKGGDAYWCKTCIKHEDRRRQAGKTQEGR